MGSRKKREHPHCIHSTANACFGEERRGAIDGSSEPTDHICHILSDSRYLSNKSNLLQVTYQLIELEIVCNYILY